MHRSIAALLAALCCACAAQAHIAPSAGTAPSLTLHRALELAGAASPSLDAAAAELRAAEAGRQIAGLRPNPSLAIDAEKDRKSVVEGKSVSVRVDLGGRRIIKKKKKEK